jgi:hypothetical protein
VVHGPPVVCELHSDGPKNNWDYKKNYKSILIKMHEQRRAEILVE